jgi:hypothetical protein
VRDVEKINNDRHQTPPQELVLPWKLFQLAAIRMIDHRGLFFFALIIVEVPNHPENAPDAMGFWTCQDDLLNQFAYRSCVGIQAIDDYFEVVGHS